MINATVSKIVSFALCTQCAWYQDKNKQFSGKHAIKSPATVCAKCNGQTLTIVGRFIYEPYRRFFGLLKGQRVRGYVSRYRECCSL